MRKILLGVAAAAVFVVSPAAFAQTVDTKAEVQKVADDWMGMYNKKDAGSIAKMYSDKAVYSTPGWTAVSQSEIRDDLTKDMDAGATVSAITVDQSMRMGEMNSANGSWAGTVKGQDGKTMTVGGHWVVVSQYHDGKYTILVHNSNLQMAPPQK